MFVQDKPTRYREGHRLMTFTTFKLDTPAWHNMWDALRAITGDTLQHGTETGEVWQYMGTVSTDGGRTWVAEFRHRNHPRTGRRELLRVPMRPGWSPATKIIDRDKRLA